MNIKVRKGFFMIEVLFTLVIIGMLFSLSLSQRTTYIKDLSKELSGNVQTRKTLFEDISLSIKQYGYPINVDSNQIEFQESTDCSIFYIFDSDNNILEKSITSGCNTATNSILTRPLYIDNLNNFEFSDEGNDILKITFTELNSNRSYPYMYWFHKPNYSLN